MGVFAGLAVVAILLLAPPTASGQQRMIIPPARLANAAPVVRVQPVFAEVDLNALPKGVKRLSDELSARLRPIELRFQADERLQHASAVMGVVAAAYGALHGTQSVTFVGTEALRLGLGNQLTQFRYRSGLAVEPSIGHRAISVTVSRTF